MAYCTNADVKQRLNITETTWDTEIDDIIEEADSVIDLKISSKGGTVPVSTVPIWLKHASANYAAYLYQARRKAPEQRNELLATAERELDLRINQHYAPPSIRRV